ncbi:YpiB family protein [Enterococcus hirae]|jgi:uncharacterized protein YpiB (UPF0302 family)|nr:YpiB family protein [Enterococcaceae bacterium]MCI1919750.1 YpiB family protein [Enterococcaceae bacterium]MDM8213736.1 YpiB family protein [Enterococcus hirae]
MAEVGNPEKKAFLHWLVTQVAFQKREIYWILNYLKGHDSILANVHFVEGAEKTPRGLKIYPHDGQETIELSIQNKKFTDPEQIFHEIRFHWKEPLFVEIVTPNAWKNRYFVQAVEDNPYAPWNQNVDETLKSAVFAELDELTKEAEITQLYQEIDSALDAGDREKFQELSRKLEENQKA